MRVEVIKVKARLLSVEQMAKYLSIGRSKAYKLVKQPDFPSIKIGQQILVDMYRLNRWIDAQIQEDFDLVEELCEYYQLGDMWMCQFCSNKCSNAGKNFEEQEDEEVIIHYE